MSSARNPAGKLVHLEPAAFQHRLSSGHTIVTTGQDDIQISDAEGQLVVRITLSAEGPVVALSGGQLKLDSTEEVAVRCKRFKVDAEEDVSIRSQGRADIRSTDELTIHSDADIKATAECIWLN